MDTPKIDVKIFTQDGPQPQLSELVVAFHTWIQQQRISDELLIDVANYAHVPEGPGVMLIGHQGHYALDFALGEPGLLYSQRRPDAELPLPQAIARALKRALSACSLLEAESSLSTPLRFRTDRMLVRFNDRLRAPNRAETWQTVEGPCRAALEPLFGRDLRLEPVPPGRELFGVYVQTAATPRLAELQARA